MDELNKLEDIVNRLIRERGINLVEPTNPQSRDIMECLSEFERIGNEFKKIYEGLNEIYLDYINERKDMEILKHEKEYNVRK